MNLLVVQAVVTVVLVSAVSGDPRTRYGSSPRLSSQSVSYPEDEFDRSNRMEGIPIYIADALNKARDLRQLERLVDRPSQLRYDVQTLARSAGGDSALTSRFGGGSQVTKSGNKNGEMAKAAACQPELTTVPIGEEDKRSNTIYWPSCTRIERCGGCCSHELLSCKPTASKTIHVQVVSMGYKGGSSRMDYVDTIMVPLEIHTACECGCKLTAQDCNQFQEYVESECRCKCVNKEDYVKCSKNNLKLWEPSTCRCKCKQQRECSTGHYFDLNTCSCPNLPPNRAGARTAAQWPLRPAGAQGPESRLSRPLRPVGAQGLVARLSRPEYTYRSRLPAARTTRPSWEDFVETVYTEQHPEERFLETVYAEEPPEEEEDEEEQEEYDD